MALQIPVIEGPNLDGTGDSLAGGVPMHPAAGTGAQMGAHALGQLAGLGDELKRQEDQARAIRVAQAENDFAQMADAALYDPQTGYLQAKGQDAIDRTGGTYSQLSKLRAEHADQFAGDTRAAQMFELRSQQMMTGYQKAIEEHAGREKYALAGQVAEDTFNRATIEAQRVYNDAASVQQVWENKLPVIEGYMRGVAGLPEDLANSKLEQLRSAVFASAAERFVSQGQGSAGLAFLKQNVPGGGTVQDALGPAADKVLAKLRPLAAQESGDAIVRQMVAEPRFQLGGRVNFEHAFSTLNDAWNREQGGQPKKPGDPVFGSFDVFVAARQQLLARQNEEKSSFDTQRGQVLTQAQTFAEQHGIQTFDIFMAKAPAMLKGALKDYASENSLRKWFDSNVNEKPTPEQQVNFTRFLWNLGNNEYAYTGMNPDQFKSTVMDNLWPQHADHARMLVFQILAQKGPVKEMFTQGKNLLMQRLRGQNLIPLQSRGDVKYNDPTTWVPEQQDTFNTAMMIFGTEYQKKVTELGGKAPSPEDLQKLLDWSAQKARVPGRWFGTNVVPLPAALGRGQQVTGFEPPDEGTAAYRDLTAQIRLAREKMATDLEAQGRADEATKLRSKPITSDDVARLNAAITQAQYEYLQGRYPANAPKPPATKPGNPLGSEPWQIPSP